MLENPIARSLSIATILVALAAPVHAGDAVIRSIRFEALPTAEGPETHTPGMPAGRARVNADTQAAPLAATSDYASVPALKVYPLAGTVGRDLFVPYYVDLNDGAGTRDFNCGAATFEGHTGHDPYIRSFREQAIGVPVFAPLDGVIVDAHDGEPDQNTVANPVPSNFIVIDHGSGVRSEYLHLKQGSVIVKKGDVVVAGQQIGMAGSSGASSAPHIHFDVTRDGKVLEPMAGPCRPGLLLFVDPPAVVSVPTVIGAAVSADSFSSARSAPFDDTPRMGTFMMGQNHLSMKIDTANLPASMPYQVLLIAPNGAVRTIGSGTTAALPSVLTAILIDLDVNFDVAGPWTIALDLGNLGPATQHFVELPVNVINMMSGPAENRPPNPITASLEPVGLRTGEVPVCRASGALIPDPDYDIVTYSYDWRVDGQPVRSVTTAAQSDAIPHTLVHAGSQVSCTITVSDGQGGLTSATALASAAGTRRHIVGR